MAGVVSSGTSALVLHCTTDDKAVVLGAASSSGQLGLTDAEFGKITANGMTIGGAACGSQTVSGVTAANSDKVSGVLTLLASRDEATVTFSSAGSTLNALVAAADKGVAWTHRS